MKLSLNWLKEFVDLEGISPEQIRDELSLKTAEVEGFEVKGAGISGVVVGQIITSKSHPSSKKPLNVLTVDQGGKIVPVVCGCPNSSKVGMKVAFAKVGAVIHGGFQVKEAALAGEASHGMCLGADELGMLGFQTNLIEIDQKVPTGTPIHEALPELGDVIFEIDNKSVTNRPDLWGHYGVARELSVIFNKKLRPLPVSDLSKFDGKTSVSVKIESPDDCYSFGAFKVENIMVKQAPQFIQTRLYYCGINPHGFLVDLSNYIMLELGQPNHAFDASRVGAMSAGRGNGGKFVTLKDQEIDAKSDYLFIKSDGKPVSLAGIMGGQSSMICDGTNSVVFEFATFNPWTIRRTSQDLGIRSDSSARYEKSLDTNLNKVGAARAVKLLGQLDKGARVASNFNWQIAKPTTEKTIELSKKYLERFTGIKFDYKVVKKNLAGLGFRPVIKGDAISITVPTWRATKDINLAVDVIEEIVRMHGFNNIEARPPHVELLPVEKLAEKRVVDDIKDLLVNKFNLSEVHTYIWAGTGELEVLNSVAGGRPTIRNSMAESLFKIKGDRVFEIGEVFREGKSIKELGILLQSKHASREELYKELGSIIRDIIPGVKFKLGEGLYSFLHPKNNASFVGGFVGIVKTQNAAVACISLNDLENYLTFTPVKNIKVSRFPKTTLDFTITHDGVFGEVESILEKFKNELVTGFRLKDIYGTKYTVEFTVLSYEKTLTAEEIQSVHRAISEFIKSKGLKVDE
ncbi:MAG: phenylalanine--tRNA ligase subunit beta [Firmicutes bacterium]|nr:phenylalanine--tRNA ligase subunit beta [Bacillota bacterium]